MAFARSDDSLISRWWWTVDRWMLVALGALMAAGVILIFGASTPVAERLGLSSFHFATRQVVFLVAAIGVMFVVSLMSIKMVRRLSVLMLPIFALLVVLTLFIGPEIKGATRWLSLGGLGLQPSEFLKPSFIVVSAWMLSESLQTPSFPGKKIALGLFAAIAALLLLQPDFGQTMLMGLVFGAQFVMAGMPLVWVFGVGALGVSVITAAYWFMPHVQKRIDAFLDPASNDTYQVDQALNAFKSGGIFGRGPGEGIVKKSLPDAHADYIFAVAGEEFGTFACLAILALFAAIVLRGLSRLMEEEDPFVLFATSGLMMMFGTQALINLAVNLALIPSKGMTLPFISYGGSSLLALGLTMGMILALTRKNTHGASRRSWAVRRAV